MLLSPRLWTPWNQRRQKLILEHSAKAIIAEIRNEKRDLADLTWQQFEELVAELLRRQGMEVHWVRENPQGGRDIVARTHFGSRREVLNIAVEVKHRSMVDRPLVQTALYQNRAFPALMFITSGRFSAGVLQEAAKPENRMRLFLKDGEAVRDLILGHKWHK